MDCSITIAGNAGTPVTYRAGEGAAGRWSRAEFRLGCNRRVRRADGAWTDSNTTWVTVQCWNRLAEGVKDSINRGDPLIVSGRLVTDEWSDNNGELHTRLIVSADIVGHDLGRGRARFQRSVPMPEPPLADGRESGGEGINGGVTDPGAEPSHAVDEWVTTGALPGVGGEAGEASVESDPAGERAARAEGSPEAQAGVPLAVGGC